MLVTRITVTRITICLIENIILRDKVRKIHKENKSHFTLLNMKIKGVLHPRPVFGLFLHFSQKLQHIGNK